VGIFYIARAGAGRLTQALDANLPPVITPAKKQLIDRIEKAWKDVPYPGDDQIFTPKSYDDEDVTRYFSGTSWKGHTVQDLRAHSSAISSFFTPAAYHYWLPAFLIAAVEDPDELSQGYDSIIWSLLPNEAAEFEARMALLTDAQKRTIIDVIEHLIAFYDDPTFPNGTADEQCALEQLRAITRGA
jgi:hypothetical protein